MQCHGCICVGFLQAPENGCTSKLFGHCCSQTIPNRLHNLVCCNIVIIILFVDDVAVDDVVVLVTCCSRVKTSVICLSLTVVLDIVPCNSDHPISVIDISVLVREGTHVKIGFDFGGNCLVENLAGG